MSRKMCHLKKFGNLDFYQLIEDGLSRWVIVKDGVIIGRSSSVFAEGRAVGGEVHEIVKAIQGDVQATIDEFKELLQTEKDMHRIAKQVADEAIADADRLESAVTNVLVEFGKVVRQLKSREIIAQYDDSSIESARRDVADHRQRWGVKRESSASFGDDLTPGDEPLREYER